MADASYGSDPANSTPKWIGLWVGFFLVLLILWALPLWVWLIVLFVLIMGVVIYMFGVTYSMNHSEGAKSILRKRYRTLCPTTLIGTRKGIGAIEWSLGIMSNRMRTMMSKYQAAVNARDSARATPTPVAPSVPAASVTVAGADRKERGSSVATPATPASISISTASRATAAAPISVTQEFPRQGHAAMSPFELQLPVGTEFVVEGVERTSKTADKPAQLTVKVVLKDALSGERARNLAVCLHKYSPIIRRSEGDLFNLAARPETVHQVSCELMSFADFDALRSVHPAKMGYEFCGFIMDSHPVRQLSAGGITLSTAFGSVRLASSDLFATSNANAVPMSERDLAEQQLKTGDAADVGAGGSGDATTAAAPSGSPNDVQGLNPTFRWAPKDGVLAYVPDLAEEQLPRMDLSGEVGPLFEKAEQKIHSWWRSVRGPKAWLSNLI